MKLKFLGTGGGRFVTGEQLRRTGGIVVQTEEAQLHVDPGPGALVYSHEELDEPLETDAVLVSHAHLDHSSDAEAVIEMMTEAGDKPGAVFANETALEGHGDIEKAVSGYHQDLCSRVEELGDGAEFEFRDVTIKSQEMFHSDPLTAGIVLETDGKTVGIWTDSEYSEELLDFYRGVDTLVIYCVKPRGESISSHVSLDEAAEIVDRVEPNTVIVTHYGYSFLMEDLDEQQEWLEDKVDAKVVFADDGMEFPGNRSLGDF